MSEFDSGYRFALKRSMEVTSVFMRIAEGQDSRRPSILRRPQLERSEVVGSEELVSIGETGRLLSTSLFPQHAKACRCKDTIDLRETIALERVKLLLEGDAQVRWLDLCCGKGSILVHVPSVLPASRSKLVYLGTDFDPSHNKACLRVLRNRSLKSYFSQVDAITHDAFTMLDRKHGRFDVVTLLNVLHEIPPLRLFELLGTAIRACKPSGVVVLVDMAELPHLELGAITWSAEDLRRLLRPVLRRPRPELNISDYARTTDVVSVAVRRKWVDAQQLKGADRKAAFNRNVKAILRDMLKRVAASITKMVDDNDEENIQPRKAINRDGEFALARLLWKCWAITEILLTE